MGLVAVVKSGLIGIIKGTKYPLRNVQGSVQGAPSELFTDEHHGRFGGTRAGAPSSFDADELPVNDPRSEGLHWDEGSMPDPREAHWEDEGDEPVHPDDYREPQEGWNLTEEGEEDSKLNMLDSHLKKVKQRYKEIETSMRDAMDRQRMMGNVRGRFLLTNSGRKAINRETGLTNSMTKKLKHRLREIEQAEKERNEYISWSTRQGYKSTVTQGDTPNE